MSDFQYTDMVVTYDSSNIDYLWYNRFTRVLAVEFQSGTEVYGYQNVPESLWEELVVEQDKVNKKVFGASVGRKINQAVKGAREPNGSKTYPGLMLGDDGPGFEKIAYPQTGLSVVRDDAFAPAVSEGYEFTVRGTEVFEVTVKASSIEDAIEKVKDGNNDVNITFVGVKFDV